MRTESLQSGTGGAVDQNAPATAPHAVVIGSGFGGLATAVRLGVKGYRVTVLERLDKPGGRAYVFEQDGFTFDAGPTIVTGPELVRELWTLSGKRFEDHVDMRLLDPFYFVRFEDGSAFRYTGDPEQMRAEVARFNPADVPNYDRFMEKCRTAYEIGFLKLGNRTYTSVWDMVRVVPELMAMSGHRSVYSVVSQIFRDPKLRKVFSLHPLLIGGNPLKTTAAYILINHLEKAFGVHFPMGGTGALIQGLADLIRDRGNRIRYNADVAEIVVENRRTTGVRLQSGETIKADLVVSNADCAWTYKHLVKEETGARWTDRKLARAHYSNGLFLWYFGTKKRYEDVPHHMIMLGRRYRELLRDIFDRRILADDFSLYLHRPTHTDPSLAPEGCDTFYALVPVPNLRGTTDWTTAAEPFRQAVSHYLSDTVLPDLETNVVSSRVITPLDFEDRYLSYQGAGFGMEPLLLQSAGFRPHNQSEHIDRLYLVGASTHPGAGIPGVLTSARVLDTVIPHAHAFA